MWGSLSALATAAALVGPAAAPKITGVREIAIHSGLNPVKSLAPDGRDGVIVEAAPVVETADQSRTDFMVLLKPAKTGGDWSVARVVGLAKAAGEAVSPEDMISAYPHTGEDQLSSIRFARARVDGAPAVLLVQAQRDFVLPIPDPSPVTIDIFRLTIDPEFDEALFKRIGHRRYPGCFDNSDAALKVLLDLPLPAGFTGSASRKPCPAPSSR